MLIQTDQGLRHKWYSHTKELASLCMAITTGHGLDKYTPMFERRETPEAHRQRMLVTTHLSQGTVANIASIYKKTDRVRKVQELYYTDESGDNGKKKTTLDGLLARMWGGRSIDTWFENRYLELDEVDPNCWVVVEFESTTGRDYAQPYLFEVPSEDAVFYHYAKDVLQVLVARTWHLVKNKDKEETLAAYTAYLPDQTFKMVPMPKQAIKSQGKKEGQIFTVYLDEGERLAVILAGQPYIFEVYTPHNAGQVPAFRCAYRRDLYTAGDTLVACYNPAIPLIRKALGINSIADQSKHLAGFPLAIRASESCPAHCTNGWLDDGLTKCAECQGTGKATSRPVSVMEELVVDVEKLGDATVDLEKLFVWKAPPVDLLRYQDEVFYKLDEAAKRVVFNADIFSKQQVAQTATGRSLDMDNLYDELYGHAQAKSDAWRFVVTLVAKVTNLDANLVAYRQYPKDFKMLGVSDVLSTLEQAQRSGAGPEVVSTLEDNMAMLLLSENDKELRRYYVKSLFNPFRGMRQTDLNFALASPDLTPRRHKVQYLNLQFILDTVEVQANTLGVDFYLLEYSEQKKMVDSVVDALLLETTPQAPVLLPGVETTTQEADGQADGQDKDRIPLAVQQLSLALQRAKDIGDNGLATKLRGKISTLVDQIAEA